MTSRIKRWTGVNLGDHSAAETPSAGPGSVDPRVEQALRTALAALEAAQAKRGRADRRRHALAGIEAAIGFVGICGLVTMLLAVDRQANLLLVALLSLAAAVPMFATLVRAVADGRREVEEIAAVESARTVAVQAAALARSLELATRPAPPETAANKLAFEMLAQIQQSAAALEGRERRVDLEPGLNARRHVRIKPSNDRIAITLESGMTIIAQLVDVSISGAMIAGHLPDVRVGDEIRVGSRPAVIVRTVERGVACEFLEPLPAHILAPNVVL